MQCEDTIRKFLEAVDQFERIVNDSEFIRLERLTDEQLIGTKQHAGIITRYLSLSQSDTAVMEDMTIEPDKMCIGDKILCLHTLSDLDDLPQSVSTDSRFERLSTDRGDCRLSYAAPVGLLLNCNHIYNQMIFIDNHEETIKKLEKQAKNMHSLSRYSRSNQINKEWLDMYLNEAQSLGLTAVRCHFNVMAWADDPDEWKCIKNEVGSQLALMNCTPRHNTVDVPTVFWGSIPGNEGDFPSEETFYTFEQQALCFFNEETNYRDSPSPFGIKLSDRLTGKPLHVDLSDEPMRRGIIHNSNRFILGPSGSGKSFFTNHMVRQYYEQGAHILLVDTGNSYKGLCELIRHKTAGEDGIYFTYTDKQPISFNPFYTQDGVYEIEKRESIKTLLLTLWKRDDEPPTRAEEVTLSDAVNLFLMHIQKRELEASFNGFYEFVDTQYRKRLEQKKVREKDFDIETFLNVLAPYYKGGEYDYLLNSAQQMDLLSKRFIVFELDAIRDHKILLPVTTLVIMETFINKMRRLQGVRKMILIEEA